MKHKFYQTLNVIFNPVNFFHWQTLCVLAIWSSCARTGPSVCSSLWSVTASNTVRMGQTRTPNTLDVVRNTKRLSAILEKKKLWLIHEWEFLKLIYWTFCSSFCICFIFFSSCSHTVWIQQSVRCLHLPVRQWSVREPGVEVRRHGRLRRLLGRGQLWWGKSSWLNIKETNNCDFAGM